MPSLYVLHAAGQLPNDTAAVEEGTVYPLLRRVGDDATKLAWAYAVPKPATEGALNVRRKHRLAASVLRALGFVLDANNSSVTDVAVRFDFFHLPEAAADALIDPFDVGIFDSATLPNLSEAVLGLVVRPPKGAAPALKLADGAEAKKLIKLDAKFGVDRFEFDPDGNQGEFNLRGTGTETSPIFDNVRGKPNKEMATQFPSSKFVPKLEFAQSWGDGTATLRCGTPAVAPNNVKSVAADTRHDRMTAATATLVSLLPPAATAAELSAPSLAIEVFPSFTFQPDSKLPITVSLGQDSVALRLQPLGSPFKPQVKVNHLKPCVRVTIAGPLVQAEASGSGALEALRLLEPAERKLGESVERLNDFLTYAFDVCLPAELVPNLKMPDLLRLDRLSFEVPDDVPTLEEFALFLRKLGFGIPLLDRLPTVNPVVLDLRRFGLPYLDLKQHLGLPDFSNLPAWGAILRFRGPDGILLDPIAIQEVTLVGLELRVRFLSLPTLEGTLEFHLPELLKLDPFDFRFPNVGLPALTEYELAFAWEEPSLALKVTFPEVMPLPSLATLWKLQLKRPGGIRIDLELEKLAIAGLDVTFTLRVTLPSFDITVDRLVVKWTFGFDLPDPKVPSIKLKAALPKVRIPAIDGLPDLRFLKLRALDVKGVVLGTFGVLEIDAGFQTLTLDIPEINGEFPDVKLFTADVAIDIALDLSFSLAKCFLSDLLGELPSVNFRLSVPSLPPRLTLPEVVAAFGSLSTPIIPLEFVVRMPNPKLSELEWDELRLAIGFRFDLKKLTLADNRLYFFLPQRRSFSGNLAPRQVFECDILTLTFPNRPEPMGFPTAANHDGYFDLVSHEFVIELKYSDGKTPEPPPRVRAYFPGGMDNDAARLGRDGVESLRKSAIPGDKERFAELHKEYTKRFELEFDAIDPKHWPNAGPEMLSFRLGSKGLTLAANLGKTEVIVDNSGFDDEGTADTDNNGLIKPFKFQPQEKLRELKSRVVIIDNELKEAAVYAKCEVPGVDGLMAEVTVALRQTKKGALPVVVAGLALERSDEAPLAELSIKLLQLSLERIEMSLTWRPQEKEWDYGILVDGTIAFTGAAVLIPDLEGLRAPSIQVVGLDLRRLNLRALRVPLKLVKPIRFEMLEGLFAVELGDLVLGWEFDGLIPRPTLLSCELAKFEFKNPGALEVAITVGGLNIEFNKDLSVHIKLPSSLGIEVAMGPTAKFAGRVGWVETDVERYFFASGKVTLEGFPETQGLLKFGTGLKYNGRREINIVLYGEQEFDEQLFAGAVVKSLGVGIGLNNRLAVLTARPSADQIISRIDKLNPADVDGWQFVREDGFYLSIVGAVTLASNLGKPDVLNAYIARLVVTFDTNFDLTAAGKLWLSCSVDGMKSHPNNPAFVGAMVLSPSQKKLEIVLESRQQAYVEKNDLIRKLLDKGKVRFAFRMTPSLVDYHLAELSYADTMFGVQMEFRGEYRFAVFKRAVLLKSELTATGRISRSLNAGPGGFDLDGQAHLGVGYGGLLSDSGIMAYAFLDAGIRFRVSAWIEIGFSISFRICGKRFSKSWHVTFRLRVPELELTFRGCIAASDRGGLVGVDIQVGINVVICGYRLNASGRLAVNPELYQEVRAAVAAFEDELNKAVRELEAASTPLQPQSNSLNLAEAAESNPPAAFALVVHEALQTVSTPLLDTAPPPERWLLYTRTLEPGTKAALLVPTADSTWITPTIASVDTLTLKQVGGEVHASFAVHAAPGVLANQFLRLFGLRGNSVPTLLNGTWRVTTVSDNELTLNVTASGVPAREQPYPVFGGVWFITETVSKLEPDDHLTVPYLNDVERVVLPLGGTWIKVASYTAVTKRIVTNGLHGLAGKARLLLKTDAGVHHDRGTKRAFDDKDVAAATFAATVVDATTLELTDLQVGEVVPVAADWSFVPAVELAPTWNARNRVAAFRDQRLTVDQYRELTGAAAEWAETAENDDKARSVLPSTADYKVVFDTRWESADPRYAMPQAFPYPGVLPSKFRPLGDVSIVGGDDVLKAAKAYEDAAALVVRQEIHGAMDLIDDDAAVQARAQATNRLVHRFSDPAGLKSDDHPEARYVPLGNDPSAIVYGWPFSASGKLVDNLLKQKRAYVRRAAGTLGEVELVVPGTTTDALPKTLPIRQEFVVRETTPTKELGRIVVKLAVKLAFHLQDGVLNLNPEEIGRFRIYRRIGDGPEVVIADHLRPDVSYLRGEKIVVPRPVLFTDEFAVIDRTFVDRELKALHGDGSFPTARYRLQVLREDDSGDDRTSGFIDWSDPVPLFIPPAIEAPRSLALAVPVSSLIEGAEFRFELVDLSGAYPVLAHRDGLAYTGKDFALGIDDEILKQTGYYIGADNDTTTVETDGSTLTLDRVRMDGNEESDHGKTIVDVEAETDQAHPSRFKLKGDAFQLGASHRVFSQSKSPVASGSLRRLPILLLRDFPKVWDETVRYQSKDTLERIPKRHYEAVLSAKAEPLTVDFSADDLYASGRSAIRAVWPSITLLEGGVELQFRDFDDSSMRSRALVEALEADRFAVGKQDFRNEDDWTLRTADRVEHYASRYAVGTVTQPDPDHFGKVYLWKRGKDKDVDRLEWIERAKKDLLALKDIADWTTVAKTVRGVQVALLAFEKSPLNLNQPIVRRTIELIRHGLRSLIVGSKVALPADATEAVLEAGRKTNQTFLELLTTIEQVPITTLSNDEAESAAFLDRDTSRKLAGIVRRRLAMADEVMSLMMHTDEKFLSKVTAEPKLARQQAWDRIRDDANSLRPIDTELPRTKQLTDQVTVEPWVATRDGVVVLLETLLTAIRSSDLGKLVPRAAGLSMLLKYLNDAVQGKQANGLAGVLKRPHNELTATKDANGETIALPVPLRKFLPPDYRGAKPGQEPSPDERLERLGLRVGTLATLDDKGHVSIWTTRGKSPETPLRRIQQFFTVADAMSVELAETHDSPLVLVSCADRFELWDGGAAILLRKFQGAAAAVFADTPRGLEVLTRDTGANVVQLHSVESESRKALQVNDVTDEAPLSGLLAYHDEARLVAACRGNFLFVWRDLGRPRNKTPLSKIDFGAPVVAVRPVTLPAGDVFVVATSVNVSIVDPYTGTKSLLPDFPEEVEEVLELVVDRRVLTATIRTPSGKVFRIDLIARDAEWKEISSAAGKGVAVLHGRTDGEDRSFIVVPDDVGEVKLYLDANEKQTLPNATELGVAAVKVIAVASTLLTARTARSGPDVVNLFHLWERMGFALDVAARNDATRLLPFADLRKKVREAVEMMRTQNKGPGDHACRITIQLEPHYVYVVEGEEPDADFREQDRVGFAHVKVAVVPESFLKACLADVPAEIPAEIPAPVMVWLEHRAINVDEDKALKVKELEHLRHLTQLVGVPTADRLGVVPGVNLGLDNGTVRLQPRAERFVRVPASAGISHWTWTLPDRKGHCMMAAARRVSRYEPLLRWWLNLHVRFDLPYDLPDGSRAPGWQKVTLDPIHDPVLGDGPQPLMVYQYPSARRPQFSYQIPLDGMRSTYNQISRVRTGWNGVELSFRYELPQLIDDNKPRLEKLLKVTTTAPTNGTTLPQRTTTNVPLAPGLDVRLFRHERLIGLPELPFFYRYRLDVRSAYKSRLLEHDRTTPADRLPDDENRSPSAQRLPACLGLNEFKLLKIDAVPDGFDSGFDAIFHVSANRDHLTREEAASEPEAIECEKVKARDLPDFVMGYFLFSRQVDGTGPVKSQGDLFSMVGSIQMPWSPDFPSTAPSDKPFVSLVTGLTLAPPTGAATVGHREGSVALERSDIDGVPHWRLQFRIFNERGQTLVVPGKLSVQGRRDGRLTRAIAAT